MKTYAGHPPATNGTATASLVIGIVSLPAIITVLGGLVLGLAAIVLGVLGLRQARDLGGAGRGQAIGGIVAGAVSVVLPVVFLLLFVPWIMTDSGSVLERGSGNGVEIGVGIAD
ncbi:MAG: DUF4190 domain-containing protein [Nitriliruptorales bacterium]|nr:DUF4190 domain-containing protein [Nitriliruptorales bacterium]